MIKFIVGILICLFSYTKNYAQPGWAFKVQGNLNNIDSTQIKNCLKENSLCYFGAIQIDSSTDLTRLNHLNYTSNLNLSINLKSLPKEFTSVNLDKIRSLHISGSELLDLSNFPIMDNLESLYITTFQGDTLKIKNKLPNLKVLEINYSDKIVSIENVLINNKIEQLSIRNCKNLNLNHRSFYLLKYLHIFGSQSTKFKWEDLVNFKMLNIITLNNVNFESIPDSFPKSLRKISISNSNTNLETLNKLSRLENIEELNLYNINVIWKK